METGNLFVHASKILSVLVVTGSLLSALTGTSGARVKDRETPDLSSHYNPRTVTIVGQPLPEKSPAPASIPHDVIIGTPRPIPYSRAFPLLDGLFQDVSAIQLGQLQLNANQANASHLDAVIQQFQAALQYSQTLGIQNASAAQQSAAFSASGSLQTQLLNQASQLINIQLGAQQQLSHAQVALNSLPSNASDEQKEAAKQAVTIATDHLTAVTAQMASVKNLMATSTAAPTFSAPAPSPVAFPTPPVTITLPNAGSNPSFSPSFPASKQMENQVNLLWERLAHLVNTLAQSENPNGISLVRFHTGITGGKTKRKGKLLSTQYSLSCNKGSKAPQVLDLFPRNAAVNISNMKYRDSRISLSGLLSFFSIGGNIAYNREHLRITQALGQSAYITGFGIETKSFGWVFSPSLAEEVVAPGDRTTFALVAAPEGCGDVKVNLVHATWDKNPVAVPEDTATIKDLQSWVSEPKSDALCDTCIESIAYAPVEFDPSVGTSGAVTINLRLKIDLDREQTITANGIVLKRARDTYGRATPAGGSGGLLQAANLDAGTWIPVSSRELVLHLNPAVFTRRFPSIILSSPKGSVDVNSQIASTANIEISGVKYKCPEPRATCASTIPAIGRARAVVKNFAVARWVGSKKFIITMQQAATTSTSSSSGSTIPAVQVITGSRNQPWSGYTKVVAVQGGPHVPLQCSPLGERLLCDIGDLDLDKRTEFEVFDSDFAGVAVKGSGFLESCSALTCSDPLIWEMESPRWDKDYQQWVFRLSLVNVKSTQVARLGEVFEGPITCTNEDVPCGTEIRFPLHQFALVRDLMSLQIYESAAPPLLGPRVGKPSTIANLRIQIAPILSFISEDQTRFSGRNLVFKKIRVGTREIDIGCSETLDCFVPSPGFKPKDEGYLYFDTGSEPFPFLLMTDKGPQVVAPHKPKPAATPQSAAASTTTAPTQTQTLQIEVHPITRMSATKPQ